MARPLKSNFNRTRQVDGDASLKVILLLALSAKAHWY